MLSAEDFEKLINSQESSILDFKLSMYDFGDESGTAKFIKDVISFANTIRTESSFIVVGVGENTDKTKELTGLTKDFDDALFQDKVKEKIFPRPNFLYYTITYDSKTFGVFEFPVTKYPLPISPTVKLKGLEVGRMYYRKGTTNTEAIGHEIITISNWLQSLPDTGNGSSLYSETTTLIKRLTAGTEKLSIIFIDLLRIAKIYALNDLIKFCSGEIIGIDTRGIDVDSNEYRYRIQNVFMSLNKTEINPYSFATEQLIKREMENSSDFFDARMFISYPVSAIEEHINSFGPNTVCMTTQVSSKSVLRESHSEHPVFIYIFKDSFSALYRSIRQKAIDHLMKI